MIDDTLPFPGLAHGLAWPLRYTFHSFMGCRSYLANMLSMVTLLPSLADLHIGAKHQFPVVRTLDVAALVILLDTRRKSMPQTAGQRP